MVNNGTKNLTSFLVKLDSPKRIYSPNSGTCYSDHVQRNQDYTDIMWETRRNDNKHKTEKKWRALGAVMQCIVGRAARLTILRL